MDAEGECRLLFVPVRHSGSGVLALRTGRLPSGQRVGLAFSSTASLLTALGPAQPWIRLHEDAMHDMLGPVGIDQIRVDARLGAPPGAAEATESGRSQPAAPLPYLTARSPQPAAAPPRRQTAPRRCVSLTRARALPGGGPAKAGRRGARTQLVPPGTHIGA
jgi:hypothetical protein